MIGARIKRLRKKYGYTQEQLARECGISARTLRSIETGRQVSAGRGTSILKAWKLANALHTGVDYLLGLSDEEE